MAAILMKNKIVMLVAGVLLLGAIGVLGVVTYYVLSAKDEPIVNARYKLYPTEAWRVAEEVVVKCDAPKMKGSDPVSLDVIIVCEKDNGELLCPIIETRITQKGFMDRAYMAMVRQSPGGNIFPGELMAMPSREKISKVHLLVNWYYHDDAELRVFTLPPNQGAEIHVPSLMTLPKISDHLMGKKYLDTYHKALEDYNKSQVGHGSGWF